MQHHGLSMPEQQNWNTTLGECHSLRGFPNDLSTMSTMGIDQMIVIQPLPHENPMWRTEEPP